MRHHYETLGKTKKVSIPEALEQNIKKLCMELDSHSRPNELIESFINLLRVKED